MAHESKQKKKRLAHGALTAARYGQVTESTGGGEPIPKGEHWTNEKRDLKQPRTEDGHFATYSSVGKTTKYPQHAWRGTYEKGHPLNPTGKKLTEAAKKKIWAEEVKEVPDVAKTVVQQYAQPIHGKQEGKIKKGTKFAINGTIYIAAMNMTLDEFTDAMRFYWENPDGKFKHDPDEMKRINPKFIVKVGGRTAAEADAIERAKGGQDLKGPMNEHFEMVTDENGKPELANLKTDSMKKKLRKARAAIKESDKKEYVANMMNNIVPTGSLDKNSDKYKANAAHNAAVQSSKAAAAAQSQNASSASADDKTQKVAQVGETPMTMDQLSDAIQDALSGIDINEGGASQDVIAKASDSIKDALSKFTGKN